MSTLLYGTICFNPCFGGSYIVTVPFPNFRFLSGLCFNPCFGGSYIVTISAEILDIEMRCFNPCFGGSYIVTITHHIYKDKI